MKTRRPRGKHIVSTALLMAPLAVLQWSAGQSVARADELTSAESFKTVGPEDVADEYSVDHFAINYTNILYGPSVKNPSSFLPQSDGKPDPDRTVYMRNFLSASYAIDDVWAVTATAYWWYRPVLGAQFTMQDPFVRISDASVFSTDWGMNLYSDIRLHAGVTPESREAEMVTGVQNFNYLSFQPDSGRWIFALRTSARYNVYGRNGYGTESELYLAPETNFRVSPKWAITLLYEMGMSHQYGDDAGIYTSDGTDLQPGVEWDPTPDIIVNPYVSLTTGDKVTLATTTFGMFFTWSFF